MRDVTEIEIRSSASIREALRQLDRTGLGVLALIDDRSRFLRTVTDGDLRRLMLQREDLNCTLEQLGPLQSVTVSRDMPAAEAYRLMQKHEVNHIPVIGEHDKIIGLHVRSDFDEPILLSTPHLSEKEREFVDEAFASNWIAPLGPNVDGFESEIAAYLGTESAAALSSGTAAIHLALDILGVGRGDLVFCPSLTFVASCNPALYLGAQPVFIDSAPGSWNMSPLVLERALEEFKGKGALPKAVIVVNLYGHSADFEPIREVCDAFNVPIVEDAAESLGARYKGQASGTLGDIGAFSFNGNKIITTSGGGMLVAKNDEHVHLARKLSTQAKDDAPYYLHSRVGYNYRMSNVLAGIGRGQLRVLDDRVDARRSIYQRYRQGLGDFDCLEWIDDAPGCLSTHWLSLLLLPGTGRLTPERLIGFMAEQGIEARRVWNPMHRQPLFAGCEFRPHGNSVADDLFERGVCLPSGSNMSEDQQCRIIESVREFLKAATAG